MTWVSDHYMNMYETEEIICVNMDVTAAGTEQKIILGHCLTETTLS